MKTTASREFKAESPITTQDQTKPNKTLVKIKAKIFELKETKNYRGMH